MNCFFFLIDFGSFSLLITFPFHLGTFHFLNPKGAGGNHGGGLSIFFQEKGGHT